MYSTIGFNLGAFSFAFIGLLLGVIEIPIEPNQANMRQKKKFAFVLGSAANVNFLSLSEISDTEQF